MSLPNFKFKEIAEQFATDLSGMEIGDERERELQKSFSEIIPFLSFLIRIELADSEHAGTQFEVETDFVNGKNIVRIRRNA